MILLTRDFEERRRQMPTQEKVYLEKEILCQKDYLKERVLWIKETVDALHEKRHYQFVHDREVAISKILP
jgi:hypothetical protein